MFSNRSDLEVKMMLMKRKNSSQNRSLHTSELILDAAESLFARDGYDKVSVRDITAQAKVNLALVTYHFGSKDKLLEAVLGRRAAVLNQERREALFEARDSGSLNFESIARAFIGPFLVRSLGADIGWRHYCRLITVVAPTGRWPDMMSRLFDGNAQLFIDALMKVESRFNRELASRAFLFCVATMMASIRMEERLKRLTMRTRVNPKSHLELEVAFLVGGLNELARSSDDR